MSERENKREATVSVACVKGDEPHYALPPLDVPPSESIDRGTHPGYHYEWVPDDRSRPATPEEFCTRKCRRPRCGNEPVMAFERRNGWWLYCGDHMSGRRISNGVVEYWHLVKDALATGGPQGTPPPTTPKENT